MARSLDEVQSCPQEDLRTAEVHMIAEETTATAEGIMPDEDRTFWADRHSPQADEKLKKSKAKTMNATAAILAAAGLSIFAGVSMTAEMLRMQPSEGPVQTVTEASETTEKTEKTETETDIA